MKIFSHYTFLKSSYGKKKVFIFLFIEAIIRLSIFGGLGLFLNVLWLIFLFFFLNFITSLINVIAGTVFDPISLARNFLPKFVFFFFGYNDSVILGSEIWLPEMQNLLRYFGFNFSPMWHFVQNFRLNELNFEYTLWLRMN